MDDPRQAALALLRANGFSDSQIVSVFGDQAVSQPADAPTTPESVSQPADAPTTPQSVSQPAGATTTPNSADSLVAVREPARSAKTASSRPICWSLHKYFKAASLGPEQAVLVSAIKPRGNSELARQQAEQAEEDRQVVLARQPEENRPLVQRRIGRVPYQRQRGGRAPRAADAPRESRIAASAAVKHGWCKWIQAETAKGKSLAGCFRQVDVETDRLHPRFCQAVVEAESQVGQLGRRAPGGREDRQAQTRLYSQPEEVEVVQYRQEIYKKPTPALCTFHQAGRRLRQPGGSCRTQPGQAGSLQRVQSAVGGSLGPGQRGRAGRQCDP